MRSIYGLDSSQNLVSNRNHHSWTTRISLSLKTGSRIRSLSIKGALLITLTTIWLINQGLTIRFRKMMGVKSHSLTTCGSHRYSKEDACKLHLRNLGGEDRCLISKTAERYIGNSRRRGSQLLGQLLIILEIGK